MEWNQFIIPLTLIFVQLIKHGEYIDNRHLPLVSVGFGLCAGLLFGVYYQADLFYHAVSGVIYSASASGLYDMVKTADAVVRSK